MNLPTTSQQIAYLRAPLAPTEVAAHWFSDDGERQYTISDHGSLEGIAFFGTEYGGQREEYRCPPEEARRALRARKFYAWFAGLEWEGDEVTLADGRRLVFNHCAHYFHADWTIQTIAESGYLEAEISSDRSFIESDERVAKLRAVRDAWDAEIEPIEKDN